MPSPSHPLKFREEACSLRVLQPGQDFLWPKPVGPISPGMLWEKALTYEGMDRTVNKS